MRSDRFELRRRAAMMSRMKFSAVIFDMDGLMLDTERTYREVFNRAAADCGVEFSDELHLRLLGRNSADTKTILQELWRDDAVFEQFMNRARHHHETCFDTMPLVVKDG